MAHGREMNSALYRRLDSLLEIPHNLNFILLNYLHTDQWGAYICGMLVK